MAGDGFLFIEETGAPHNRVTRAKIKMHVMDRVVKEKSTSKSGRPRVRRLESNDGLVIKLSDSNVTSQETVSAN